MSNFLLGLLYDLIKKCDVLIDIINSSDKDIDIEDFSDTVKDNIVFLRNDLFKYVNRIESNSGKYSVRNIFMQYKTKSNQIILYEYFSIPLIQKYDKNAKYYNKLLNLCCDQIEYPDEYPFISTLGHEYYFCYPPHSIIVCPLYQSYTLLNLPDLYHELGHFLFNNYQIYFFDAFKNEISKYFNDQQARFQREGSYDKFSDLINKLEEKWKSKWAIEFYCDLIATYLVGSSYGWANIHMCANFRKIDDIYFPETKNISISSHPSDDSRMKCIFGMIKMLKLEEDYDKVEKSWDLYKQTLNPSKPDHYNLFYPEELMNKLTNHVYKVSKDIGLLDYNSALTKFGDASIVKQISEGWTKFTQNPKDFVIWESHKLDELRKFLLPD